MDRIEQNFDLLQVVLFGSYASGTEKEFADIDVAVFVNEKQNANYLEESALLFRLIRGRCQDRAGSFLFG